MVKNSNMKSFTITIPKDFRLGQTLFEFLSWMRTYEDIAQEEDSRMADPYYLTDDRMIELWHKYLQFIHAYDRKQEQTD